MTRRSKRELERSIDAMDEGDAYPMAGLTTFFQYEWEVIDAERRLIRLETGEVMQLHESIVRVMAEKRDREWGDRDE